VKQNTASQRVASELRARVRSGKLAPGDVFPSARQITEEFGVALATAQKVLTALRREGLLKMKPGQRTVVRARGDEPDLSRAGIVTTAIAIADDEGIEALAMRGVATEMAVPTMSLYRHVASKDALLLMMADSVLGEESPPPMGDTPWRDYLRDLAELQWAVYTRHPWLPQVLSITRPQILPKGMRHTEAILRTLDTLPLDALTKLRTGIALLAYVRGLAVGIGAERTAEQDTGLSEHQWLDEQEAEFKALAPQFPTLERLSSEVSDTEDMSLDALFRCGLERFLDGVEASVQAKGKGDRSAVRSAARERPKRA
jgi:DNA-binding transcriptional regulator YhcF (GntR family)